MRKLTAMVLSLAMTAASVLVAVPSVSASVDNDGRYVPGDDIKETRRYYFAMPETWYNQYTDTAGVYWYCGSDACGSLSDTTEGIFWPGYKPQIGDFSGSYFDVYYIDCPANVPQVIWNNYVNGGTEAKQSNDAPTEFYAPGDSDLYGYDFFEEMEESYWGDRSALGEFADNFFYDEFYGCGFVMNMDNMIFVVPSEPNGQTFDGKPTYNGDWYFYYGNGEYGTYPTKEDAIAKGVYGNLSGEPETTPTQPTDPIPTQPTEPIPTRPTTPTLPSSPDEAIPADECIIKFDVKKSGWNMNTTKKVYCHIWRADGGLTTSGEDWPAWQSKKELCDYDPSTGIATFDLTKTGNTFSRSEGKEYLVIFSANTGMQTYSTVMSGACIGDTVYCTGESFESPEDSERQVLDAVWVNNADCGTQRKITSTGKVVGRTYTENASEVTILADYVLAYYQDSVRMSFLEGLFKELGADSADVYSECQIQLGAEVLNEMLTYNEYIEICNYIQKILETIDNGTVNDIFCDLNGDGGTNVSDVTEIQKYCVDLVAFTSSKLQVADVDNDGRVSISDATTLQKYLAS